MLQIKSLTKKKKYYQATTIEKYSDLRKTMYISISIVVFIIRVFRMRGHQVRTHSSFLSSLISSFFFFYYFLSSVSSSKTVYV